ncbi:MAG: single-stranded-DNA-specific exonuclease RecJ [Clostridia bacterium]|nr:single-stranded-DNA-specific exonuclease RecJ [Clostridia bacterium]
MTEQTKKTKKWSLLYRPGDQETDEGIHALARETGLSEIMARLLYTRGYPSAREVISFLRQEESQFHDPYSLLDMSLAVERIFAALKNRERIAIYGDYDVDGVTSVSLLYLYLKEQNAEVEYYIPSRIKEGYGVSASALEVLKEHGVTLMITVDTGITAMDEIEYAGRLGIDTVVTDHHECRAELPKACAVVNPHRMGDPYPFKELAGVGVVFKLISALEIEKCRIGGESAEDGIRRVCSKYADLVCIGTIADVMPIVDENRLIVSYGLRLVENTKRPGLRALIEAASGGKTLKKRKINSSFIGFVIAPRMNAAGRVSDASIAVELLLTESREDAHRLADQLCELNLARQVEENRIAEQAYQKIEETLDGENNRVIVIENDTWQQGIIGIVSSRITERYGLPSILISFDGSTRGEPTMDDLGKGSGRSVKGLNLVEALTACEDLLVRFGGHELAAGLTVQRCNIDAFRKRINRYAAEQLGDEPLCVTLDADCEVETKDLTMQLAQDISALEPFGVANPVPVFVLRGARLLRVIPMGGGKHIKLTLEKDGVELTAVWFGVSPLRLPFEPMEEVDVMFQLNINEFQNTVSLQLLVQDMQLSEHFESSYESEKRLYDEIRQGAAFSPEDDVIPTRDDMATVYKFLRREYRSGHSVFTLRRLLAQLRMQGFEEIRYTKLKFIIRIMQELLVCGVTETDTDHYVFEFYDNTAKTNIEKSSILHKLKKQLRKA